MILLIPIKMRASSYPFASAMRRALYSQFGVPVEEKEGKPNEDIALNRGVRGGIDMDHVKVAEPVNNDSHRFLQALQSLLHWLLRSLIRSHLRLLFCRFSVCFSSCFPGAPVNIQYCRGQVAQHGN